MRYFLLGLLGLLLIGCDQGENSLVAPSPVVELKTGEVSVAFSVGDIDTGLAIPRAWVTICNEVINHCDRQIADDNGKAYFTVVTSPVVVSYGAEGYKREEFPARFNRSTEEVILLRSDHGR